MNTGNEPILQVRDLEIRFNTDDGVVQAVNGIDFELAAGETLGVVGESGSGKSVTNLALLGLIPQPPGEIVRGSAMFRDQDLLKMGDRRLADIRGNDIAMIFQDPMTALNPFLTVEQQLTEVTRRHLNHSRDDAIRHAIKMLERVGIPSAERRLFDYPHQFSGGMRQRVMIAMALSCKPDVLIADEPTTALDVTIQAQILDLMKKLQEEEGTAIIMITHDLGVVAGVCDRVAVMYAGRMVEKADCDSLFQQPAHPYTLGLLQSVPRWDEQQGADLHAIDGQPPDMTKLPPGCPFEPRCEFRQPECLQTLPPLEAAPHGGLAACLVDLQDAKAKARS